MHRNEGTTTRFSPTGPGLVRQSHRLADFSGVPTFAQQPSSTSRYSAPSVMVRFTGTEPRRDHRTGVRPGRPHHPDTGADAARQPLTGRPAAGPGQRRLRGEEEAAMGFEHILVERSGDFATVTMNRPERRNALSLAHMQELITALREIGDSDALGIVLAGNGPVFSAGHDFADVVDADLPAVRSLLATCTELMTLIQQVPQPVVARVHGLATAAGLPAGRERRPRRGQRERRLRRARRQGRLVLPHPDGGGRPQRRPEAGRGDGPVGRRDRRPDRAGLGPGQPGGARPGSWTPRSPTCWSASRGGPRRARASASRPCTRRSTSTSRRPTPMPSR